MNKLYYGQVLDDSDSKPEVVEERAFNTEAEADAYAQGVNDAALACEHDSMSGTVSDKPAITDY
jgi:hypothetical protein